jgi:hypothetical protein
MFTVLGFRFIWNCVEDCWAGRFSVFVLWFSFASLSWFTLKFAGFCTQNCTGCFQTKASCWGSWQRILFAFSVSWLANCSPNTLSLRILWNCMMDCYFSDAMLEMFPSYTFSMSDLRYSAFRCFREGSDRFWALHNLLGYLIFNSNTWKSRRWAHLSVLSNFGSWVRFEWFWVAWTLLFSPYRFPRYPFCHHMSASRPGSTGHETLARHAKRAARCRNTVAEYALYTSATRSARRD